jgi:putative addiction module component (TIGR02574 family)
MSPTADSVLNAALSLPRDNRAVIAERLVESLSDTDEAEVSPAWQAELRQRVEAYRRGEMKTIPADEVFDSLGLELDP